MLDTHLKSPVTRHRLRSGPATQDVDALRLCSNPGAQATPSDPRHSITYGETRLGGSRLCGAPRRWNPGRACIPAARLRITAVSA
jgi:hypothetical protein